MRLLRVAVLALFCPVIAACSADVVDAESEGEPASADVGAIESECSSLLPTWIGGRVYGEDGRAINALIGLSFTTDDGAHLDKNGKVACKGNECTTYSVVQHVNPQLPATGAAAADGNVMTWGKCVGMPASKVWIEVYPRGPDGKTSFERYGAAVDNRLIKPGVANVFDLRLPVRASLGGNSGAIGGAVTCNGAPAQATVLRGWSNGAGDQCGIQGFAASGSTELGSYRIDNLAAGQCNAPTQFYQARVTAECNGRVTTQTKFGDVARNATTRIDFAF